MWHPRDLFWHRYLAGELGLWERLRLKIALALSAELRIVHQRLVIERAAFDAAPQRQAEVDALIARLPAASVDSGTAELQENGDARARSKSRRSGTHSGAFLWAGGFAVAAASLFAVVMVRAPGGDGEIDVLTAKGGNDTLTFYIRYAGGVVTPLGSVCHPGDQIRARYRTARRYLMVLGEDSAGSMQVLFPMDGTSSAALSTDEGATPDSWEMDETPGEQRFIGVFSEEPLAAAAVIARLRGSGTTSASILSGLSPTSHVVEQKCRKEPQR